MNDNLMCKLEGGLYTVAKAISFSILGIEITNCKLSENQRTVITVPRCKMRLLYNRASDSNYFDTNLIRKCRGLLPHMNNILIDCSQ